MSILKGMREEVTRELAKPVWIPHPVKVEWRVAFRAPTDRTEINKLRKKAEAQKDSGDFDAALVAACCEQVKRYDEVVTDEGGNVLTFRDQAFQDDLGAPTAREAVRAFYGSDGYVSAVAMRLLEAAGWGADDVLPEEDPT